VLTAVARRALIRLETADRDLVKTLIRDAADRLVPVLGAAQPMSRARVRGWTPQG